MLRNAIWITLSFISFNISAQFTPEQFYNSDASEIISSSGYVRSVLRETKDSYFVLLLDKPSGSFEYATKAWIHKFDSKSIKKTGEIELFSIDEDANKYSLEKIFSTHNGITIILKQVSGNNVTYYAQSLDDNLKLKQQRIELLSFNTQQTECTILINYYDGNFALLFQDFVKKGEGIGFNYHVYNQDIIKVRDGIMNLALNSSVSKFKAKTLDLTPAYKYLLDKQGDLSAIVLAKRTDADIEHILGLYVNYFDTESKLSINDFIFLPEYAFIDSYRFVRTDDKMFVFGTYSNSTAAGMKDDQILDRQEIKKTPGSDGMFVYQYDLKSKSLINKSMKPFTPEQVKAIEGNNPVIESYGEDGKPNQTLYLLTSEYFNENENSIVICGEFCENEYLNKYFNDEALPYLTTRGNIFAMKYSLNSNQLEWINSIPRLTTSQKGYSNIFKEQRSWPIFNGSEGNHFIFFYPEKNVYDEKDVKKFDRFKSDEYLSNVAIATIEDKTGKMTQIIPPRSTSKLKDPERFSMNHFTNDETTHRVFAVNKEKKKYRIFRVDY